MDENQSLQSGNDSEPDYPSERELEKRFDNLSMILATVEAYLGGYSWKQAEFHALNGQVNADRKVRVVFLGAKVFNFSFRDTFIERIELSEWINTPIDDPSMEWRTISNADLVVVLIDSILQEKQKKNIQKLYAVVDSIFFWQSKSDRASRQQINTF